MLPILYLRNLRNPPASDDTISDECIGCTSVDTFELTVSKRIANVASLIDDYFAPDNEPIQLPHRAAQRD